MQIETKQKKEIVENNSILHSASNGFCLSNPMKGDNLQSTPSNAMCLSIQSNRMSNVFFCFISLKTSSN